MNLLDFKNIEEETVATFLLDIIFLFPPGLLLVLYFFPDIFLTLDVLKLIFLAVSFIAPFVIINTFIFLTKSEDGKGETFLSITAGLFLTNIVFYIALFFTYLFKFSFKTTIFEVIILEIIIIILLLILFKKRAKN